MDETKHRRHTCMQLIHVLSTLGSASICLRWMPCGRRLYLMLSSSNIFFISITNSVLLLFFSPNSWKFIVWVTYIPILILFTSSMSFTTKPWLGYQYCGFLSRYLNYIKNKLEQRKTQTYHEGMTGIRVHPNLVTKVQSFFKFPTKKIICNILIHNKII